MKRFHQYLAWFWLFCIAGFAVLLVDQLLSNKHRFINDITYLLPEVYQSPGQKLYQKNLKTLANKQLLMMLRVDKASSAVERSRQLKDLHHDILSSDLFFFVDAKDPLKAWLTFYQHKQHQLLPLTEQQYLKTAPEEWHQALLANLYKPFGLGFANSFIDDPLEITQRHLSTLMPSNDFSIDGGFVVTQDEEFYYYLCRLQLIDNIYDIAYQKNINQWIEQQQKLFPNAVAFSGLVYHAAYASQLAKKEMSSIGLISLVGIMLLLLLLCRSLLKPVILLLPIFIGFLSALALSLLVFKQLHTVVLVFGAALIGVAVDYSLHYFLANKEKAHVALAHSSSDFSSRLYTLNTIVMGLFIGLLSTLLAYAAQAIPPFPGLRQMSFFAIAGLGGAWITVVLWFPYLLGRSEKSLSPKTEALLIALYNLGPRLSSKKAICGTLLLALSAASLLLLQFSVDDGVQQLNTSTKPMLQDEQSIQKIYSPFALGQYFVIEGESSEQLLLRSEQLSQILEQAKQNQIIKSALCLSDIVPSEKTQRSSYLLMQQQVYNDEGIVNKVFNGENYKALNDQLHTNFKARSFSPITVSAYQQADFDPAIKQLYIGHIEGFYYGVCQIAFNETPALTAMDDVGEQLDGIYWVDQTASVSHLLEEYRKSLLLWVGLAYVLVLFILYLRYGMAAWRIVFVPAFASLICLLLLNFAGVNINLFHLLALLLILGIGLDANIFMTESKASIYTWLAVSSSLLTSVLAFGLLAFSQTPVLHFIGQTVFIGLFVVWLLTPSFVLKK